MNKKFNGKDTQYNVLEWRVSAFTQHCKTIMMNSDNCIHKINLDNGDEVYLVPKEFYLAAKASLKKDKETKQQ
jgi:capsule polysaccharide modification protein KpsS